MKFGVWYAGVASFVEPVAAGRLAGAAESVGFESLWAGEHIVVPGDQSSVYPYSADGKLPGAGAIPMAEPLIWYAYVAALTKTIRFATGVLVVPQRNPLLLAKQVATLDRLSGGRFTLGVGIGWLREEFAALGVPFERRGERLEEYLRAMRAVWRDEQPSFEGEFVRFERAQVTPKPVARSVPIVVGGHSEAAAERAGRIAEGFFPAKGSTERIGALYELARESALRAGRDPQALELTVADPELSGPEPLGVVERWRRVGASRLLIRPPSFDPAAAAEGLAAFGEDVISKELSR